MKLSNRAVSGVALAVVLTALPACSTNTAIIGRDTLPAKAATPTVRNEVVGTVDRVDTGSSEIYLRPSPGHPGMVTYSAETRVIYLGRVYPVSQLQSGDVIAMHMEKDARGNPHTHAIDLQKSSRDWAQSRND
jgi:hypothetical protein